MSNDSTPDFERRVNEQAEQLRVVKRILGVVVFLVAACTLFLAGSYFCGSPHFMAPPDVKANQAVQAYRFPTGRVINIELLGAFVVERVGAVQKLLMHLGGPAIDTNGMIETGMVTVTVEVGTTEWKVDFHLVWPNPQLNNQHINSIKLVAWTSALRADHPINADTAREKAIKVLRDRITTLAAPGGPLEKEIALVGE